MDEMIEQLDAAKKVNPLDLSSDQDLSIALMNLISLEEHFFFSGAKTGKVGFYDLINIVRDMRGELMARIVKKNTVEHGEVWCISKHLLAASMRLKEVGDKANKQGKKKDAQDMYGKAYELYSLFWGINMDLIDMTGVKEIAPEVYEKAIGCACDSSKPGKVIAAAKKASPKAIQTDDKKSVAKRLGEWVKNAVNCCIE